MTRGLQKGKWLKESIFLDDKPSANSGFKKWRGWGFIRNGKGY